MGLVGYRRELAREHCKKGLEPEGCMTVQVGCKMAQEHCKRGLVRAELARYSLLWEHYRKVQVRCSQERELDYKKVEIQEDYKRRVGLVYRLLLCMKAVEVLVQEYCRTVELLEGYRTVAGQEGYKKALGRQGGCKKVEVMVYCMMVWVVQDYMQVVVVAGCMMASLLEDYMMVEVLELNKMALEVHKMVGQLVDYMMVGDLEDCR